MSSSPAAQLEESIPLINELQQTVRILSKEGDSERIYGHMDTCRFIDNDEEQVIDSDQDLTDQIVNQYTVQPVEESEDEQPVQPEPRVPISEAIAAAKTLQKFHEQQGTPVDPTAISMLRKLLQDLESKRVESRSQSTLTS